MLQSVPIYTYYIYIIYIYISVVIVETKIEIEKHTKCKHDIFDPVSSSKVTRTY